MAEITEFIPPKWAEHQSVDEVHAEMLQALPDSMEKAYGGFAYDLTRPTALVKSELMQFSLMELFKNIFPQWAYEQFLDYHAENRGLRRKAAVAASVTVTVTGTMGTKIPMAFSFSTVSKENEESQQFLSREEVIIGIDGSVDVPCRAQQVGKNGNVTAGAIVLMTSPMEGITGIHNESGANGGDEAEGDEALRQRILAYDRTQGASFVGSDSDYKRWAEEFEDENISERVGNATILDPSYQAGVTDSDKIKIVITNSNGAPASDILCQAVYDYIMQPDNPIARLAPINAQIKVIPPTTIAVYVKGTIELLPGYLLETATRNILSALKGYLLKVSYVVKYSEICKMILSAEGVSDYSHVFVSTDGVTYTAENIRLDEGNLAITSSEQVVFTSA